MTDQDLNALYHGFLIGRVEAVFLRMYCALFTLLFG
jgi:hypothetical protein